MSNTTVDGSDSDADALRSASAGLALFPSPSPSLPILQLLPFPFNPASCRLQPLPSPFDFAVPGERTSSFQTHLIGNVFEYKEQGSPRSDLVVEFCKDVQKRSQEGYLEFGRFVSPHSFLTGSGPIDYIQKMHNGDLVHCETTFHKMGRTAQVNIICGHCSNKVCKDEQGCICNISYHERMCRFIMDSLSLDLNNLTMDLAL
ncbi:hypothetical protein ZEAMMB73_Zm00001d040366 [Zea mays]|uniref:Uncharacterized protein n=1 Tax=Zea mays TaxID=4577 RepID=A0A1D6MQD7_MAIZE|nr:hypothetical protein ZEAMMB73_Zm00001d040366 [Zea mays]